MTRLSMIGEYLREVLIVTLRATLETPQFLRHGETDQTPPLVEGATATFTGVKLTSEG